MENNNRVYSQSLESIIRDHDAREGIRDDSYDIRPRRGELRGVYRLEDQILAEQKQRRKKRIVTGLKIIIPASILASLFIAGYTIVKHILNVKDIIIVHNFTPMSGRDISAISNQKRVGEIMDKLAEFKYDGLSNEDIKYVCDYIRNTELSNYDNNGSSIFFNLKDFFGYKVYFNKDSNYQQQSDLLESLDELYQNCFVTVGKEKFVNEQAAKEYLNKALSVIFMYDVTFSSKGSNYVPPGEQASYSPYANASEIYAYQALPPIIRYIITNQSIMLLQRTNYTPPMAPSNYAHSDPSKLDRGSLINELKDELDKISESLENALLPANTKM